MARISPDLWRRCFPPDAVIKALGLATTVQAGYRFSVQQGHLGFTCDSHHVVRDWSSQLSSPTAPVIHLHGALDQVVSVANIAPFAQARDNVSLRLLPDAGQTLMFEHPDVVYDAIQELLVGDKA